MPQPMTTAATVADFPASETKGDLAGVAWEKLRADIIAGNLAPGTRLRIALLRAAYGIGATPLREALSRLVSERLVVSLDRRGFAVAPISLKELRELTDLRKLLEKEALQQALTNGDEKWEADIVAAVYRLRRLHAQIRAGDVSGIADWETLNQDFHEALVAACDSPWLLHFRRTVYLYMQRYRQICLSLTSPSRNVHKEHVALQDAAIARDYASVCVLIDTHLEKTYQRIAASGSLGDGAVRPARR
jgi:DNA-binding GntR family transcriptional regulator